MPRDITGTRYGKLVVTQELPSTIRPNGRRRRYLLCACDCGGEKSASWDNLASGGIDNCGCESNRHGGTHTKLYGVWHGMKQRCYDENYQAYHNYGARGISICEEWHSFKAFRMWAETSGYAEGLTIDRVDNDGPYSPDNCRWATSAEQSKNKRTTVWVEHEGVKLTAADASRLLGVPLSTVLYRHKRNTPVGGSRAV